MTKAEKALRDELAALNAKLHADPPSTAPALERLVESIAAVTKQKNIGVWLGGLLLALAISVWPTRYKMERVSIGTSPSVLVRVDRITGKPEMLTATGWGPMEDTAQADTGPVDLPSDQVKKLDAHGGWCISSNNSFCIDLYNGSNWRLNGMSIFITAKNDDGSVRWERRFDKKYLDIGSFASDEFYIDTGDKAPKHEWYILSVSGKPPDSAAAPAAVDKDVYGHPLASH